MIIGVLADYVPGRSDLELASAEIASAPAEHDVALIVTRRPDFDLQRVVDAAPLVVDFHGATKGITAPHFVQS